MPYDLSLAKRLNTIDVSTMPVESLPIMESSNLPSIDTMTKSFILFRISAFGLFCLEYLPILARKRRTPL